MKFSLTKLWVGSYNLPNSLIKLSIKPVSVPPAMPGPCATWKLPALTGLSPQNPGL